MAEVMDFTKEITLEMIHERIKKDEVWKDEAANNHMVPMVEMSTQGARMLAEDLRANPVIMLISNDNVVVKFYKGYLVKSDVVGAGEIFIRIEGYSPLGIVNVSSLDLSVYKGVTARYVHPISSELADKLLERK